MGGGTGRDVVLLQYYTITTTVLYYYYYSTILLLLQYYTITTAVLYYYYYSTILLLILLLLGAVYMGGGTGRLPGLVVKRDLAMHVYISYLSHSVYMERILLDVFSSRSGKAGSRFAQQGSRLKRDNFCHINTPFRFAGTILC